jgi:hypothetical protein
MPTKFHNTIILPSDGKPMDVLILGLWELDEKIPQTFNEPFVYHVQTVDREVYQVVGFDTSAFDEPPEEPDVPMTAAEPGSVEWYDWKNYQTYQAALEHGKLMKHRAEEWMRHVTQYVIFGRVPGHDIKKHGPPTPCVSAEDRQRIATPSDHQAVTAAALTPRVEKEHLAEVLRQTFPG